MQFPFDRRQFLAAMGATAASPLFAQTSGNVVVYTSNNQQAVQSITDVARTKLPNLKFNFVTGGSGVLLKRMETELSAPQADLFWSSSANTLGAFKHLFEPYRSPEAASIPAALAEPNNLWTASNVHLVTAMVNRKHLGGNAEPKVWKDMLDPRWKGKIIIADPANSSTAYTILWGVKQMLGAQGLRQLANNVVVTSAAATVLRAVAQGEYAVGLTFEANAYAYVAGGQKEIRLLYPEDGTFSTPEFLVLGKNAPNGDLARRAFDHIISKEVQIALLENAFRRPSRSDIDVSQYAELPNLASVKVFAINETEAAARRKEFLEEWTAAVAAKT
ncbi:MAG: extracellular solute-binding protein [Polaromonas sp.]|nr:extracellular solute-binding protein [Polaromonas sp.]